MAHRKWKETKLQPGTAGPGNMPGSCLTSFHFLWAILCPQAVQCVPLIRSLNKTVDLISGMHCITIKLIENDHLAVLHRLAREHLEEVGYDLNMKAVC